MKFWLKIIAVLILGIIGVIGFILLDYAFPELNSRKIIALAFGIELLAIHIIGLWKLFNTDH